MVILVARKARIYIHSFCPKECPTNEPGRGDPRQPGYTDSPNLSLLDACQADVRDSVILDAELNEYEKGSLSFGTGPSYQSWKKENMFAKFRKQNKWEKTC